jgi:phage terminase large subunit GpA-like protein
VAANVTAAAERLTWELVRDGMKPPSRLPLSQWAARYRMLSSEANPEPGPWRNDRAPYQVAVMDALTDPLVERVSLMCCSQSGKTEIFLNAIGYYSTEEPSPILAVRPSLDEARQWSQTRLAPMIRDTPALTAVYAEPRARDASNTALVKNFLGGHVTAVGSNSPAGLAAKPIRIALFDEIDRYQASAGEEGDPVDLGIKRTVRFPRRKILLCSSPGVEGVSRIKREYLAGDQNEYHVPCPVCDHPQVLRWKTHIRFDAGNPESVLGYCEDCGVGSPDYAWHQQLGRGEWRARAPRIRHASFWWNAFVVPWIRWAPLVDDWYAAQGNPEKLQVFVNTVLTETWEEYGGRLRSNELADRVEEYPAPVPDGVAWLAMGVDVQGDRLEYLVRGFGVAEESWLIVAGWIEGDPKRRETWHRLDECRSQTWARANGRLLGVDVCCVDSGNWADEVYDYTGPRWGSRVYAAKGSSQPGRPIIPNQPLKRQRGVRAHVVMVGTEQAKDTIYARLRLTEPGPGAYHWPTGDAVPEHYWGQVTAEKPTRVRRQGQWIKRYELPRGLRSEGLDMEVLCLVGWRLLRRNDQQVRHRLAALGEPPPADQPPPAADAPTDAPLPPAPPTRGGWIRRGLMGNNWRPNR